MFFYGLEPGDEVSVDIERGKTLIVRFVAVSDGQDDGMRTVFFELNGQPRSVKVADRSHVALKPPRRKVELTNPNHVAAPMPGTVATVPVSQGGRVSRGDVLVTIEAMKMETTVRADRDATVAEVVTHPGEKVDSKDLLVVLA
jgi:pyruvate carboxylase